MAQSWSCPRGHRWLEQARGQAPQASASQACPVCGELAMTLPAATLPPGRPDETLSLSPAAGDTSAPPLPTIPGYEVLSELGRGGMGVVYQARQVALKRIVALKMILLGHVADQQVAARFRVEAESVARLRHPNVVQVYEIGSCQGLPFFSLEFVEGGSLAERLRGEPQPPREAARLVQTLARAVHAAHEQGVVHRDLKPANVLLAPQPGSSAADHWLRGVQPKITDFGLAKQLDDDGSQTRSGDVMGSPSYMAPEQAAGRSAEVGPAADVYALGAILYETLTGRPPFRGASVIDTLEQVTTCDPVRPRQLQPALPRDLETICLKCLEKSPARRYASAADLADDLQRFLEDQPIAARPASRWERGVKWVRRHPTQSVLVAASLLAVAGLVAGAAWYRREMQAARAASLVQSLATAELSDVGRLVDELAPYRNWADPLLRERVAAAADDSKERLHYSLALLPSDSGQVEYVLDRLLDCRPPEFAVIAAALRPHAPRLKGRLWDLVHDPGAASGEQLRALAALATFDAESRQWPRVAPLAVTRLKAQSAVTAGAWVEALRPVGRELLDPLREVLLDDAAGDSQLVAASALAEYAADRAELLVSLLCQADVRLTPILARPLERHAVTATQLLEAVLAEEDPALREIHAIDGPRIAAAEQIRDATAQRQARAAAALVAIGRSDHCWSLLSHQMESPGADPRLRTYLIHQMRVAGIDFNLLIEQLSRQSDPTIRQALLLALEAYSLESLNQAQRSRVVRKLLDLFTSDPDPGIHSASYWLLRRWQLDEQVPKLPVAEPAADNSRLWFMAPEGHTMAIVRGPVEFDMGVPGIYGFPEHPETEHRRWIGRSYALATCETTVAQFGRWLAARGIADHPSQRGPFTPQTDCPVTFVNWYEAAGYCNWLSEQAGIPRDQWCYEPNAQGEYAAGMRHADDYLEKTGYRLPTEAEWEYACRCGSRSMYSYGSDVSLLSEYGWYMASVPHLARPVGLLRPNRLGLFDMHGNVVEWCSDGPNDYPGNVLLKYPDVDIEPDQMIDDYRRSVRGGQFPRDALHLISARRRSHRTPDNYGGDGFRVARTMPTPGFVVFHAPQHVRYEAELPIDAGSASFEVRQVRDAEVSPQQGTGKTTLRVTLRGSEPRQFSFEVHRLDTGEATAVLGYLDGGRIRWHTYATNGVGMWLAHVPAGEFRMGSSEEEIKHFLSLEPQDEALRRSRIESEGPQHRVQINGPLCMSAHEVTYRQFQQFVDDTGYQTQAERDMQPALLLIDGRWTTLSPTDYSWQKPGYEFGDDYPVVNVTWEDAQQFCKWLSGKEGVEYRLPSEAEWEYACRAGTTTPYFFGASGVGMERYAWINTVWGNAAHPVGRLFPNAWGLFDMYGNTAEWCQDLYAKDYYQNSPLADPPGAAMDTEGRVIRGNYSNVPAHTARSAARHTDAPSHRGNFTGFRVVTADHPQGVRVDTARARVAALAVADHPLYERGKRYSVRNVRGDVSVQPQAGTTPGTPTVTSADRTPRPYSFDLVDEATGETTSVSGTLLAPQWQVSLFSWQPTQLGDLAGPTDAQWQEALAKEPASRRSAEALNFDWGIGAPADGVGIDYFGAIATCEFELPAGYLDVRIYGENGTRVYLDDQPVRTVFYPFHTATIPVPAGRHTVRIEYCETVGPAHLQAALSFRR